MFLFIVYQTQNILDTVLDNAGIILKDSMSGGKNHSNEFLFTISCRIILLA